MRKVGLKIVPTHIDFMSTDELLAEIEGQDKKTYDILQAYIEAYADYITLSNKFNARLGQPMPTTPEKNADLQNKTESRNLTRNALIKRIDDITSCQFADPS